MSRRRDHSSPRKDSTVEAMLDAARDLFATRGFTAVTVRDIARGAGVSHALVHRYLGSKQEIYRAVLERDENVIREAAGDTEDLLEAVHLMFREGLEHHRAYLRLVAHSALHGLPFSATMGRFPATERLTVLAEKEAAARSGESEDLHARFAVAATVALFLGWASTADWVLPAAGLEAMDEETAADELESLMLRLIQREVLDVRP
jgi:AcrR family transcriptional regulator